MEFHNWILRIIRILFSIFCFIVAFGAMYILVATAQAVGAPLF